MKPLIVALPYWLRLVQCMVLFFREGHTRHFLNAVKYFSGIAVVVTSNAPTWPWFSQYKSQLFIIWIVCCVVKTIFCFIWDLYYDWGFLRPAPAAPFLRKTLVFEKTSVYYFAIVTNLLGRISWTLAISTEFCGNSCTLAQGIIEIIRRGQWLIFRQEEEFVKRLDEKHTEATPLLGHS